MATSRRGKKKSRSTSQPPSSQTRAGPGRPDTRQPLAGKRRGRAREIVLVGAILAATTMAFANSLDGEFVYDDQLQVLQNPTIKSLSMIPRMMVASVWQFMSQGPAAAVGPYYRPLFNIVLIINYHLFGFEVGGWHVVSLLLHLSVTGLVYALSRQYGIPTIGAAVAAAVFGLHPVHSESVAWVSGIPDPLAAVFVIGAILTYERWRVAPVRGWPLLALTAALSLLAMLSKEIGVAVPLFIVVREAIDREDGESRRQMFRRASLRSLPFFAVTAAYLVMRYSVLGALAPGGPNTEGIPAAQLLLTIPAVLMRYARLLIIPRPLSIVYDQTFVQSASDPQFWLASACLLATAGVVLVLVRRSLSGRLALAMLILFLLPVLNLRTFRPEESLLHDRYLYVPSIGFSLLLAAGVTWIFSRWGNRLRSALLAGLGIVAIVLFGLTAIQNKTWQNEAAMTGHALAVYPQWPFMHNYLGARYYFAKNFPQAEREFELAIRSKPTYADAHSNLGDALIAQGRLTEAEQSYLKAIELGVKYADTRYNLGVVYLNTNRPADAEKAFLDALAIDPRHERSRYNLGYLYDTQNRSTEAAAEYAKTIQYNPAFPEPRISLAAILIKQGRYSEAIEQLTTAARYAPDNPSLLYQLGDAYRSAGRFDEAIATLNQVLARQPRHPLAYTTLGLAYEGLGKKEQARVSFERAIQVAPADPMTSIAREHLARL